MNVLAFMLLYFYMLMMKREYKGRAQHHHTAPTVCIYFHLCDDDEGCCSYSQTQNTFIGRKWLYIENVFLLFYVIKTCCWATERVSFFYMYRGTKSCWWNYMLIPLLGYGPLFLSLYNQIFKKMKKKSNNFPISMTRPRFFFFVPHNNTRYVMCWAIISLPGGWFSSCLECAVYSWLCP
jgi:hypothetical protein